MNEIKSKRYPGLIKQAKELHADVETKGWKLAEVIHEAVDVLKTEGFRVYADRQNKEAMTAARRVAHDMGVSSATVETYYLVWRKFGEQGKRDEVLTFADHVNISRNASRKREIKARRLRILAKPAGALPARRAEAEPVDAAVPFSRFSKTKSQLKRINDSNIWDYPDREKALAYAQEIAQLAQEVLVKFGGQVDAEPAKPARRRSVKAAA